MRDDAGQIHSGITVRVVEAGGYVGKSECRIG